MTLSEALELIRSKNARMEINIGTSDRPDNYFPIHIKLTSGREVWFDSYIYWDPSQTMLAEEYLIDTINFAASIAQKYWDRRGV